MGQRVGRDSMVEMGHGVHGLSGQCTKYGIWG